MMVHHLGNMNVCTSIVSECRQWQLFTRSRLKVILKHEDQTGVQEDISNSEKFQEVKAALHTCMDITTHLAAKQESNS